jgi:hypothetical protein
MAKRVLSKRKLSVERLPWRYAPLRRDKAIGSYEVDNYIGVVHPNSDRARFIKSFRLSINWAGRYAVFKEGVSRQILPRSREEARRIIKLLDTIDRQAAGWIDPADDEHTTRLSNVFVPTFKRVPGFRSPERLLSQVFSDIQSIRKLRRQLTSRFTISRAERGDQLARYFIEVMASTYKNGRGKRPPRGRSGPFVNLVAAAWRDLGFPIPVETRR